MLAFHSSQEIKDKYLARIAAHRVADELIKGTGWENGKGCAVGCTLEAYEHFRYETELGIPQMLAYIEDAIFEGLSNGKAQAWPERFLSSIEPGKDLSLVGWKFLFWIVETTLKKYGTDEVRKGCSSALEIVKRMADGLPISIEAAESARSAAWSARSAAESAAESAAWSARSARSAAWSAAYEEMSDKLIELLEEA
jgi:hypothetical protein